MKYKTLEEFFMELSEIKSIDEPLESIKVLTGSISCHVVFLEDNGYLHQHREASSQLLICHSEAAKHYFANHNEIHVLNQNTYQELDLAIDAKQSVVYIPIAFHSINIGALLLEQISPVMNPSQELFFHHISKLASLIIGSACGFSEPNRQKVDNEKMIKMLLDNNQTTRQTEKIVHDINERLKNIEDKLNRGNIW
jgi:transcriptional regulator with GAF, ATPase, and Fis domain